MDLITATYKDKNEPPIVINLEQMAVAMPREGNKEREGEEEGEVYTSFVMTVRVTGMTLDTLLPYEQFLDLMEVAKEEPNSEFNELKEIVLISKSETENVLDKLRDLIKRHSCATVADYYTLCDVPATYIDDRYGWTDLSVVATVRKQHGWVIQLPEPERLGE